jgi:hypothetical protein
LIKVIFLPRLAPSPYPPVEYYVDTDNYKTAEDRARQELQATHENHQKYDQVILAHIQPLKVKRLSIY